MNIHIYKTYPRSAYAHDKTSHTSVDDDTYNMNTIDEMVEIGIDDGRSLPMWTGMFKNAHVYGIDKVIKEISNMSNKDKCTTIKADQSNANDLKKIKSMLMDKNIFFINDDGSHIPEHQLLSFNILFPIFSRRRHLYNRRY